MVAQTKNPGTQAVEDEGVNAPDAVVFRGDGEPKTPEGLVALLSDIVSRRGIEADNYSNGGVVRELEERFAGLLGKEDAVFMPSGTLANHLALRLLCAGKPRAIVQEQSHLYHDTGDCVQQLSGINMVPLAAGRPYFTLDEVRSAVEESTGGRVVTPVGSLMIESPGPQAARPDHASRRDAPRHRLLLGTGYPDAPGWSAPVHDERGDRCFACRLLGYVRHGVRLAVQVLRRTVRGDTGRNGADFCRDLYHHRRMFGGGLSSAALAAALALEGVEGFEDRFAKAMSKARELFRDLNEIPGLSVGAYEHGSNIFPLSLPTGVDLEPFANRLAESRVFVSAEEDAQAPPHLTVNTTILRQSNEQIVSAFRATLSNG